ncbi:TolB family protein [Sphingobacterium cellulitidis]|nr:hypothetical protein [Sphingobacterium soli]MBA8986969.1 hypothetical protein [Sphingobacterium soli]
MKTRSILFPLILLFMISCAGCSKDDQSFGGSGKALKNLPGSLYWQFAGDVGQMDFSSGKNSSRLLGVGPGSSRYDSYDISWDNKKVLITMDVEGAFNFTERRFVLRDKNSKLDYNSLKDGNNNFDIRYEADDIEITDAHISPDERFIALDAQHFADLPVTIIDSKTGNLVSSWMVKGVSFLNYGIPVWTSDNTLYFRIGNSVYKSFAADGYQSAPKVFSMEGISSLTVNPQGTKFAFRKNRHLWMCNIDGSDLKQITTSQLSEVISYDGEHRPIFSPDGKYIAFTGASQRGTPWSDHDYPDGSWVATVGGKYGYIVIIPADGKQYNLEDKDSGAIWLKQPDSDYAGIPCSSHLIWR